MINTALVIDRGLSPKIVDQIKRLHSIRDELRSSLSSGDSHPTNAVDDLITLNYTLQDLWGFPRDKSKHQEAYY